MIQKAMPDCKNLRMIFLLIILGLVLTTYPSLTPVSANTGEEQNTATWITMDQNYTNAVFSDVAFLNATHGWVVGQWTEGVSGNGIILHTKDAGVTWETQLRNGTDQRYYRIDIINEESIWVAAWGVLYHSSDCGTTWEKHVIIDGWNLMVCVEFINANIGWTATNSTLYKTVDGGTNWNSIPGWIFSDVPRDLHFISDTEVFATGFYGIYHSTDGAETWARVYDDGGWALSIQDDGEGWAVGDGYLVHTSNGIDWKQMPIPGRAPFRGLTLPYFTDILFIGDDGWIVASEIPIMHTPDGGSTWYTQSIPSHINRRMMALDFLNSTHGWAVGYDGAILKTTTGTDLGTRLWNGMTDPLFLSIVGGLVSIVVVVSGGLFYRRRKRNTPHSMMIQ